ncbi:MAG: cardiolipin synthase, partial [Tumebacillaceae bacterium]
MCVRDAYYKEHTDREEVVCIIVFAVIVVLLAIIGLLLVGTVIFFENRNPEKTVAWLIILAVFPVIGFILYLVLGRNARKHKLFHHKYVGGQRLKRVVTAQAQHLTENEVFCGEVDRKKRLVRLLLRNARAPLTANNRACVLTNGQEKFAALFEAMRQAKHHIHLQYYIFKNDEIGHETHEILRQKAREGVEVRVILDGLGSRQIPEDFLDSLRGAGAQVEMFFPLRFPFVTSKLNFRNHRKIVVVDGRVGFVGGMNIGDEYLSRDPQLGFWRDTHLQLEGDSVHMLQMTFLNDWYFISRQTIEGREYYPIPHEHGQQLVQVIASGPDSDWESIRETFFTALATAERKIYIETPYF